MGQGGRPRGQLFVSIVSKPGGRSFQAETDDSGGYEVLALPPGRYRGEVVSGEARATFEVDPVIRALRHGDPSRYTVVAVLPDGRRCRVLGNWDCFSPTRAQSLAAQLNGILGREERPPILDEVSSSRVARERALGGCILVALLILLLFVVLSRGL